MTPRQWYRIENAADPAVADIHVIDIIGDWLDDYFGFGVTAKAFVADLAKLPEAVKTIRVHVNSPGGDVFGAVNIANALRDQQMTKGRTVETLIEGLAASAASIVIMAGSRILIGDNAMVMVHNPWSIAIGESKDLRKTAADLDTIRGTILATYRWHSELSEKELGALMDAETWMGADEAIANGFATEKVVGLKAAASLDKEALAKLKVPDRYRDRVAALVKPAPAPSPQPQSATASEVLAAVDTAGLSAAFARELIEAAFPLDQVTARIAGAVEARAQADARATEIRALCKLAKAEDRADAFIAAALPLDFVKSELTWVTAKLAGAEIDAGLAPDPVSAAAGWSKAIAKVQGPRKGAAV